jgi:ribosomal 50S subunit-recycling heat shock protein
MQPFTAILSVISEMIISNCSLKKRVEDWVRIDDWVRICKVDLIKKSTQSQDHINVSTFGNVWLNANNLDESSMVWADNVHSTSYYPQT